MICYYYTHQVKTDEIGQARGTHEYKIHSGFCGVNLKKKKKNPLSGTWRRWNIEMHLKGKETEGRGLD